MLKKILGGALVLLLLVTAWNRARISMMSDEELIERQLNGMVEGFHGTILRRVLRGFHEDYLDRSSGYDRENIADALRYMFFQPRDKQTKRFAYRLEIPSDELVIVLDGEDPPGAEVSLQAIFTRTVRGEEEPWWDARAQLYMVKEGGSWVIRESSEVNHGDRHEGR